MKIIALFLITSLSFSAFASSELVAAKTAAVKKAIGATGEAPIFAWQVTKAAHDVETQVLSTDGKTVENRAYDCHHHGTQMFCHYSGLDTHHEELEVSNVSFNEMLQAETAAISFMEMNFANRGTSFDQAVESYIVWKEFEEAHHHAHEVAQEGHDHGHDHKEGTVWAKFHFELNGTDRELYTECHRHPGETDFVCHPSLTAKGDEPEFEGEEDHDHDHGHAH